MYSKHCCETIHSPFIFIRYRHEIYFYDEVFVKPSASILNFESRKISLSLSVGIDSAV